MAVEIAWGWNSAYANCLKLVGGTRWMGRAIAAGESYLVYDELIEMGIATHVAAEIRDNIRLRMMCGAYYAEEEVHDRGWTFLKEMANLFDDDRLRMAASLLARYEDEHRSHYLDVEGCFDALRDAEPFDVREETGWICPRWAYSPPVGFRWAEILTYWYIPQPARLVDGVEVG